MRTHSRALRARLWLEHNGLFPRGKLSFFTLYVLALDLLLILINAVAGWFRIPYADSLGGWIVFLTLLGIVLIAILGARWSSSHLLWRMRTRLVVTYAFIGVIPLILLVVIAGLAFYLFSGQFAAYIVTSRVDSELRSLSVRNTTVASRLASDIEAARTPTAPGETPSSLRSGQQVTAWLNGNLIFNSSSEGAPSLPENLRRDITRVVQDRDVVFLRSVTEMRTSKGQLTVLSSRRADQRLLSEWAGSLGEVTLYRLETGTSNPTPIYTAGNVPPARRALDFMVVAGAEIPVLEWQTGGDSNPGLPVSVRTRLSALYDRAFSSLGDLGSTIEFVLFVLLIVLLLLEAAAWWVGTKLSKSITGAVGQLYRATTYINRGDFSHRIPITSNDQLAALSGSFNSMTESIEKLILEQKEKQRLQHEINIAQEVQAQLFPRHIAQLTGLEVHGFCRPARSVSGDYYDFLSLGAERLLLAVGDVSGKGISAALLMATIHSAVRAYVVEGIPALRAMEAVGAGRSTSNVHSILEGAEVAPGTLLSLLNHQLYHTTPAEKYATLFLAMYDSSDRRLTFSNAGHLPPLVLTPGGDIRRLEDGGTVVGLFDNMTYDEKCVSLRPGEIFLAYSDGVTEPENDFGEFGEQRLIDLVQENRDLPLHRISELVTAAVDDWIGGLEQPDDVTLVLARAR